MLGTILLVIAAFVGTGIVWLGVHNAIHRAVKDAVPLSRILGDDVLFKSLRGGQDNSRVMILHRESNLLIQVEKALGQDKRHDKVKLRVLKKRAVRPRWFRSMRWRRALLGFGGQLGEWRVELFPFWCLPSPRSGEVLLAVDCGSSLVAVREAIKQIVRQDDTLSGYPVFDLWSQRTLASMEFGKFDEDPE